MNDNYEGSAYETPVPARRKRRHNFSLPQRKSVISHQANLINPSDYFASFMVSKVASNELCAAHIRAGHDRKSSTNRRIYFF